MNQKIISIYAVIVTIVILLQLCTRKDRITVPENYFTDIVSESQAKKMLGNGWTVDVIERSLRILWS